MNKSMKHLLSAILFTGSLISPASAALVVDFSDDLGGFYSNTFGLIHHSSGLGTDGYVEVFDKFDPNGAIGIDGGLIGDLGIGGSISFDAIAIDSVYSTNDRFGKMQLFGAGTSITVDAISTFPSSTGWQTFTVDLNPETWGVSESTLTAILSDLDQFVISAETDTGMNERIGFDNFAFENGTPTPVPGAALLLAPALALGLLRRKAQGAS